MTMLCLLGYGEWEFGIALLLLKKNYPGGTMVSHGEISIGDLTSLLMYTVYVGSGLQMLTYVPSVHPFIHF